MTGDIFSENHEVEYYETNLLGNMTLSMLTDVIIMISQDQATALGVGTQYVIEHGVTWVVAQTDMDITRLPRVHEKVQVQTRGSSYTKYFAYREFWVRDMDGNELVHVGSLWVMMDIQSRKMVKLDESMVIPYHCDRVRRIQRLNKIPKIHDEHDIMQTEYHVRFTDIDWNSHVNNAKYIGWMVDVLPYDFLASHVPTEVSIKYEDEVTYGDPVLSRGKFINTDNQIQTVHDISVNGSTKSIAEVKWKKLDKKGSK
ncbi:acyl-[acyl-carrier-protein] thioesterase [Fructilactobacillus fructivorans]|uniref:ACP thioesterase n=1 Tax=Fructilactobacillus fructivorans TaxID=1614 RepID=A0AAE6TYM5_9LACO|nr:acyl-ACP thioesterase domain-containing protein [Fructilactobacillus fructivorans]KRK57719.1 acyl-ACP thioesterase [Fructilactobacillus fructivorans]KRN40597.1 acyl-ACP thioesterase [Fructilactobacillus fructivorans]KRN43138.1 acyl-ACP thioesterase [Fructilactobacillus fructivorans]QFX93000.1 ACP thioesterase [Fructilactobacillus fructivorans]RDV65397.1 ACP thioesterase [Fructilactobacillus fructivorans]